MDQRNKNRVKEHTGQPDHFLAVVKDIKTTEVRPGQTLWHCQCGWLGWLDDEATELILNGETK